MCETKSTSSQWGSKAGSTTKGIEKNISSWFAKWLPKAPSPFEIMSPNKYLYLKFLQGYNFNGNLDMKVKGQARNRNIRQCTEVEQGIETHNNALRLKKEQKHIAMHWSWVKNKNTWWCTKDWTKT